MNERVQAHGADDQRLANLNSAAGHYVGDLFPHTDAGKDTANRRGIVYSNCIDPS